MSTERKLKSNNVCFYCDQKRYTLDEKKKKTQPKRLILHRATTMNRDKMIRQFAVAMGGTKLTEKVSEGGIISRSCCYRHKCMTEFTNSYRNFVNDRNKNGKDKDSRK